jgi:hypothetical protein
MMAYHMKDDDRKNLLNYVKPVSLPIELAQNLAQNLKDWISGVYAPAYISFMLSQTPTGSITWNNDFNDKEKAKVWYWFSGSVSISLHTKPIVLTTGRVKRAWPQPRNTMRSMGLPLPLL